MSAPTPEQLHEDIREILNLAPELRRRYDLYYESGYRAPRFGEGERTAGSSVNADGTPRGVAGVLASRSRIRSKLDYTGRSIARARSQLRGALTALNELQEILDDEHPEGALDPSSERLYPRTVTSVELKKQRRQRQRRRDGIAKGEAVMPWTETDEMV